MFKTDEEQIQMIESAMKDIANKSCIKFRAKENDEHAVLIKVLLQKVNAGILKY